MFQIKTIEAFPIKNNFNLKMHNVSLTRNLNKRLKRVLVKETETETIKNNRKEKQRQYNKEMRSKKK